MSGKVAGNLNFRTVKKKDILFFMTFRYRLPKIHGGEGTCFREYILMFCHLHMRFLKRVVRFLSQCFSMRTPSFLSGMGKYYLFRETSLFSFYSLRIS